MKNKLIKYQDNKMDNYLYKICILVVIIWGLVFSLFYLPMLIDYLNRISMNYFINDLYYQGVLR